MQIQCFYQLMLGLVIASCHPIEARLVLLIITRRTSKFRIGKASDLSDFYHLLGWVSECQLSFFFCLKMIFITFTIFTSTWFSIKWPSKNEEAMIGHENKDFVYPRKHYLRISLTLYSWSSNAKFCMHDIVISKLNRHQTSLK